MYWCNQSIRAGVVILLISGLQACKPDIKATGSNARYFELSHYIKADSARLASQGIQVVKTVSHNNSGNQTRQTRISNWGRELAPFSASDLNKPAWRDSYAIQHQGDSVLYTAKYPDLVTRRMMVEQQGTQVKKITISNFTKNLLYQTTEQLVYIPDSLYIINKVQQVRLLGTNRYSIRGIIKK